MDKIKSNELIIANRELIFQDKEKEKRAAELIIANKELAFQNAEKEKRAAELIIANKELIFQNQEKEKRAADLIIISDSLKFQKEELRRANKELQRLNQHLENRVFERTCELEKLIHEQKDLSLSKDKLLAVISHDLRNPLAVLLLASEELKSESENNIYEPIRPYIEIIHRSSLNIFRQLNELVDWAKSKHEKAALHLEKISLVSAVYQSFELLKANTIQKSIILENKVPSDLYVNADALMLRSILQNLVTNSVKYSFQGGLVVVSAKRIDNQAEVCGVDSGMGMDEDTRENLFIRSNSASVSGTNNEVGSGLGLILVKDFVSQHGGTLRVESEIRKGTRIYFTVPASLVDD
jgi:two-component system, sensor histidine kinase and response regulator